MKFGISFTLTAYNQAGALVHIYRDGSIHLNHGGTEMGQGLYTKVAQVVAQAFQVDIDRVRITATSTGKEIGRASSRERVCQYVYISGVAGSLKNKTKKKQKYESKTI